MVNTMEKERNHRFLKDLFLEEIREEIEKFPPGNERLFTEKDIEHLPVPVQNYIRGCGYIGKPFMINARINWKDVYFKRNGNANLLKLECFQFNSTSEPCRIVYMKSRLAGIFPFEGRDKYQHGMGNMYIKLLSLFTLTDSKCREMDISGLVTTLAETLLLPSQAVQHYIKWSPCGDYKAKAVIEFGGNSVSGIFEFNEQFEITRFYTEDRYQSQKDGSQKKVRWAGIAGNYIEKNGYKFPSCFKAVWYQDSGDLEYFTGTIDSIIYNIKEFGY
jgi:hypothetical protein